MPMAHFAWMAHSNKKLWLLFLIVKARNLASFRGDGGQWGLYVSQLFMFPYRSHWTEKSFLLAGSKLLRL